MQEVHACVLACKKCTGQITYFYSHPAQPNILLRAKLYIISDSVQFIMLCSILRSNSYFRVILSAIHNWQWLFLGLFHFTNLFTENTHCFIAHQNTGTSDK